MKNILTLLALILIVTTNATAQAPYTVSTKTDVYRPLENAISLNNGTVWDDAVYKIPLGFKYTMNGIENDVFYLQPESLISHDTTEEVINGIVCLGIDLIDRGADSNTSLSPVSYKVEGAPGNRICKIEITNAGFYDELSLYGTLNDYINVQFWLYEADSKFEIHFGSSRITHPTDYFYFGNGPLIGYAREFNYQESTGIIYSLRGAAANPVIDSISFGYFGGVLDSYPADSTVYVFNNLTLSVSEYEVMSDVVVYPTQTQATLNINLGQPAKGVYRIVSMNGALIGKKGDINGKSKAINVSDLQPGLYMLQVNIGGMTKAFRFYKM